jgi:O-antigen ligase
MGQCGWAGCAGGPGNLVGLTLASASDRLGGAPLGPAAVCAAAVAIALGYVPALDAPFVEPKLAVLLMAGALGLSGHLLAARAERPRRHRGRWLASAAGLLLLTTALAALAAWRRGPPGAPYAADEIIRWLAVLGVALGAAQAAAAEPRAGWRRRLCEAIHAGAALVSLLGLLQHFRALPFHIPTISVPGSTFGNRNLGAEAVAAAFPFGLGLIPFELIPFGAQPSRRTEAAFDAPRLAALALTLAIELGYLAVARARGAWLGGALGIAVFFALRRPVLPRAAFAAAIGMALVAALAAIVPGRWTAHDSQDAKRFAPGARVVREALDPSSPVVRTRLGLWRRTLALYREHPLLGVGPGNFAVVFPRFAEPGATADGVLSPTAVPRRAHDDLLERLAETGPLGLGALLALYAVAGSLAVTGARRARRDGRPADAGAMAASAGSLAAIAGSGITGFPLAMPATTFVFGVALGLLAAGDAPDPGAPPPVRVRGPRLAGALIVGLLAVAGAAWWSARRICASYFLARAEASRRPGDSPDDAARALPSLARAARAEPGDFKVALLTASASLRAGRAPESVTAAARALAIEPDSANAWEALARARLETGDANAADAAATRALAILHDYPGALYTHALAAARRGDGAGAASARARLAALAVTDGEAQRLIGALAGGAR